MSQEHEFGRPVIYEGRFGLVWEQSVLGVFAALRTWMNLTKVRVGVGVGVDYGYGYACYSF